MKRNINKIVAATLLATTFVACSDEIENGTYGTPYNANTSSIASAGTAVDLGLPSGTMWADKNVGAASAQDMGLSFIWGDVTGTQLSIAGNTYSQGANVNLEGYFKSFTKEKKTDINTIQIASKDVKVVAVDSVRPNYACDLLIERHADVKVKDETTGEYKVDEKGEYIREPKVFVEVEGRIVMSHTEEEYNTGLAIFLMKQGILVEKITELTGFNNDELNAIHKAKIVKDQNYVQDDYNKYVIVKAEKVFFEDVIQKLTPAEEDVDVLAYIAETKKAKNKDVAWSTYSDPTFNEEDGFLHANLIVEAYDTVSYAVGQDWATGAEITALSIVGNAELDAATKNWGAGWAMPTSAQLEELIKECTWEFVDNAYKVTGKNGNSIFLPAAGYRYEAKQIGAGASGYYASGEVNGSYTFPSTEDQHNGSFGSVSAFPMANVLTFNAGQFDNSKRIMNKFAEKNIGLSIRPVVKK